MREVLTSVSFRDLLRSKKLKAHASGLLCIIFTIFIFPLIGFVNIVIVTPLLPFPEDECYYHLNRPPILVKLFYLDSMGHIDPIMSKLHLPALLLLSVALSFSAASRLHKWLNSRKGNTNS